MLNHGLFEERNFGFKARNLSCFDTESDFGRNVVNEKGMLKTKKCD